MNSRIVVLSALAGVFFSGTATAEPTCQVDPGKEKFYRLEWTVPATFCASNRRDPSCERFPKHSPIQLHGLWPNYVQGYPEGTCSPVECKEQSEARGKYCAFPEPPELYASPSWTARKAYMAGTENCLERHEWVKHGTCSPLKATEYFDWSLRKTQEITDQLALPVDTPISKAMFDKTVAKKLPELKGAFNLSCRGKRLNTLHIRYTWEPTGPGTPIKNASGRNVISCPNKFILPSKP